jgi:DMSO/TMAO reductase YedYZ heme-binding membrane subunit
MCTRFDYECPVSYNKITFGSIAGSTGFVLLFIILAMWLTSFEWIRRNHFQVFSYVHMLLFPFFFLIMIAHGGNSLFNFGFPTGAIFIPIPFMIYFYMIFKRVFKM